MYIFSSDRSNFEEYNSNLLWGNMIDINKNRSYYLIATQIAVIYLKNFKGHPWRCIFFF